MNIENFKNNWRFYNGFEGETEIILTIVQNKDFNIHIWEGYFDSIFGDPVLDGGGWNGFTRDYNQMERSFGNDDYMIKNADEYFHDLLIYKDKKYEYPEINQCYELLRDFLKFASDNGCYIHVHVF